VVIAFEPFDTSMDATESEEDGIDGLGWLTLDTDIPGLIPELDAVINRGGVLGEGNPPFDLITRIPIGEGETGEMGGVAVPAPHQGVLPTCGPEVITDHADAIGQPWVFTCGIGCRKRDHGGALLSHPA
jgi:hypothetical protein